MTANCSFDQIGQVLRERSRFVVMSHMRPDGDALGCSIAMGLCLRQLGKDVTVWNEDGVPEKFHFLPEWQIVAKPPTEPQSFEVIIALDTAVQNRAGTALAAVAKSDVC